MTKLVCPYTRLIEPLRDDLLSASERAAVEKHLDVGCDTCQAEIRYLDWLQGELRRSAPAIDEVSLQRKRMPLLLQAAQQRQLRYTHGQQRLGAVKGALAAAAVIGFAWLWLDRTPRVNVARLSGQGEIRRSTEGERSIVQLNDGSYELQVSRGMFDRSLLVRLPDGELEDLGTSFGVTVSAGHTSRVVVSEGAVQLRLQGLPHVTLEAGSSWELHRDAPVEAPSQTEPPQPPQIQAAGAPTAAPPHDTKRSKVSKHAAATNSEDAMYLHILDLLREDRKDAARSLAERYLKEFPDGFRRGEVVRIASPQP